MTKGKRIGYRTSILKTLRLGETKWEIETLNEGEDISDHNPILLKIEGNLEQSYRIKHKTNWRKLTVKAQETIRNPTIIIIAEFNQGTWKLTKPTPGSQSYYKTTAK